MSGKDYYLEKLNELRDRIHANNVRLGFHEPSSGRPFDGALALVHAEVSEALEEWRSGKHGMTETYWTVSNPTDLIGTNILRFSGKGLQVHNYDYNVHPMDPHPQPGDPNYEPEWLDVTPELVRNMPNMIRHLKPEGIPSELADIIIRVLDICGTHGIDIASAIADKMAYNETRSYRHGGKLS